MDPETIGQLLALVLVLAGWAACVRVAVKTVPRSNRLAGFALACGLVFFPALCGLALARKAGGTATFVVVGVSLICAGFAALVLAVWSMSARKADGGTARVKPVVAIGLAAFSGLLGIGLIFMSLLTVGGGTGTPWTHRVDPPGFEVTLPSQRWRKADTDKPREVVRFGCPNPSMVAGVTEVRPAAAAVGFETAVADVKRLRDRSPTTTIEEKRERNSHGHEHWYFLCEENSETGRIFVGMSVTWWNKTHAVIMIFEGQHRMASRTGQDQESETFRSAARSFLSSVK